MSERLTRGLAVMLEATGIEPEYAPMYVTDMMPTPTGQALAALVEAAERFRVRDPIGGGRDQYATYLLDQAIDAWLAATEETT